MLEAASDREQSYKSVDKYKALTCRHLANEDIKHSMESNGSLLCSF